MNFENLKNRADAIIGFIKRNYLYILMAVVTVCLAYFSLQTYLDERAAERQQEQIKKYEREFDENRADKMRMVETLQHTDSAIREVLSTMTAIDGNLTKLVESDRQQDIAVFNLQQEYQKSRKQNEKNKIHPSNLPRVNLPLKQREFDALRTDSELYGDDSN